MSEVLFKKYAWLLCISMCDAYVLDLTHSYCIGNVPYTPSKHVTVPLGKIADKKLIPPQIEALYTA